MDTDPTYFNPIHPRPCPDPFVLKFNGEYWCYGTGFWHDGRCFGVLRSNDLVRWRELPGAMAPLAAAHREYWAPEVTYWNGRFYMYYSCGDGVEMQIRVAVADHPAGPYEDAGLRLSRQDFAIDPHVFQDEDGSRYMFYATDFLDHSHIGTGTVVDRMIDPFTLKGAPRPVARAHFDWQVYDPHRLEKGGVRWHTVEGPFVLKRKGRYYQMYSGGNWQNTSYGVSYAVTPRIDTLQEWTQLEHDERRPLVLRTLPGKVIGPGHNSVIRGPDNLQLFCVYHRWASDRSGRLLSIDRLEWIGDRIEVLGPSTGPQPTPAQPGISGFSDGWTWLSGRWTPDGVAVRQDAPSGAATASLPVGSGAFVIEASARLAVSDDREEEASGVAACGLSLCEGGAPLLSVALAARPQRAEIRLGPGSPRLLRTPADFDSGTWHLLRLEADGETARLLLDGLLQWEGTIERPAADVQLFTSSSRASFAGFALTGGWNDLFLHDHDEPPPGWYPSPDPRSEIEEWFTSGGSLVCRGSRKTLLVKKHAFASYELVVNARLGDANDGAVLGIVPALDEGGSGPCFSIEISGGSASLCMRRMSGPRPDWKTMPLVRKFPLPNAADWTDFQQFRFCKGEGRVRCDLGAQPVAEEELPAAQPTRVALFADGAPGFFEMVRLTASGADRRGR